MISFTYGDKEYKLEVTALTLKQMVKSGVSFAQLEENPLGGEILWKGMFIAHHNNVPDAKRMEIYRALSAVEDGEEQEYDENGEPLDALMSAVGAEYENALNNLKRTQGNIPWKRS